MKLKRPLYRFEQLVVYAARVQAKTQDLERKIRIYEPMIAAYLRGDFEEMLRLKDNAAKALRGYDYSLAHTPEFRAFVLRAVKNAPRGSKAGVMRSLGVNAPMIALWAKAKKNVDFNYSPSVEQIVSQWVAPEANEVHQATKDFTAALARERSAERLRLPVSAKRKLHREAEPEQPPGVEPRWSSLGVTAPNVESLDVDLE